jgi:hypothetical protein
MLKGSERAIIHLANHSTIFDGFANAIVEEEIRTLIYLLEPYGDAVGTGRTLY